MTGGPGDSRDHDDDDEEPEQADDRGQDRVAARPRLPLAGTWRRILRRVAGRVSRLLVPRRRVLRRLRVGLPLLRPGLAAGGLVVGHVVLPYLVVK